MKFSALLLERRINAKPTAGRIASNTVKKASSSVQNTPLRK